MILFWIFVWFFPCVKHFGVTPSAWRHRFPYCDVFIKVVLTADPPLTLWMVSLQSNSKHMATSQSPIAYVQKGRPMLVMYNGPRKRFVDIIVSPCAQESQNRRCKLIQVTAVLRQAVFDKFNVKYNSCSSSLLFCRWSNWWQKTWVRVRTQSETLGTKTEGRK